MSELMNDDYEADVSVLGIDKYPIFDEDYRPRLNRLIVDRFWLREIGQETDSVFRHHMRRTLNERMPYYNDIYRSTKLQFDPLSTMDMTTVASMTGESDARIDAQTQAENTSSSASTSRVVSSDTPQTQLANDGDYASALQDSVSESTGTGTSSGTEGQTQRSEQEQSTESRTHGRTAPGGALLLQYRETLLNVDMMVLNELEPLFMVVWSNGDSHTPSSLYNASPLTFWRF